MLRLPREPPEVLSGEKPRPALASSGPRGTAMAKVPQVTLRTVVGLQRSVLVATVVRQRQCFAAGDEGALGGAASGQSVPRAFDEGTVSGDHGGIPREVREPRSVADHNTVPHGHDT
jgi:hypothetical protein